MRQNLDHLFYDYCSQVFFLDCIFHIMKYFLMLLWIWYANGQTNIIMWGWWVTKCFCFLSCLRLKLYLDCCPAFFMTLLCIMVHICQCCWHICAQVYSYNIQYCDHKQPQQSWLTYAIIVQHYCISFLMHYAHLRPHHFVLGFSCFHVKCYPSSLTRFTKPVGCNNKYCLRQLCPT